MASSPYYLAHGRRCAASTSGSTGNPPRSNRRSGHRPRRGRSLSSPRSSPSPRRGCPRVRGRWLGVRFYGRCADRGDAVVLAAPVAAVVGCLVVARGARALALLRRRRGAERLAWVKLMAAYLLAMDLVDESTKRRLFRYVPACRTHKVWEWGCSNHPAAPLTLGT